MIMVGLALLGFGQDEIRVSQIRRMISVANMMLNRSNLGSASGPHSVTIKLTLQAYRLISGSIPPCNLETALLRSDHYTTSSGYFESHGSKNVHMEREGLSRNSLGLSDKATSGRSGYGKLC